MPRLKETNGVRFRTNLRQSFADLGWRVFSKGSKSTAFELRLYGAGGACVVVEATLEASPEAVALATADRFDADLDAKISAAIKADGLDKARAVGAFDDKSKTPGHVEGAAVLAEIARYRVRRARGAGARVLEGDWIRAIGGEVFEVVADLASPTSGEGVEAGEGVEGVEGVEAGEDVEGVDAANLLEEATAETQQAIKRVDALVSLAEAIKSVESRIVDCVPFVVEFAADLDAKAASATIGISRQRGEVFAVVEVGPSAPFTVASGDGEHKETCDTIADVANVVLALALNLRSKADNFGSLASLKALKS